MLPGQAWADCKMHYNQSVNLLKAARQKIDQKQHPDADAFSQAFQTSVDKLQEEKCLPELMSLIQHIQTEQQKLPAPTPGSHPAPIVD